MKLTDCIEVPAGIIDYLLGEAKFVLENGSEADAYLRRLSTTEKLMGSEIVDARAASVVAVGHMATIVDSLQKILDEAES